MTRRQACCLLILGQLGLCIWAHFLLPAAVSDDDYARVVIAQRFAERPVLDPSGTSWLPLPFWWTGAVMLVLGPTLAAARVAAFAAALAGAFLLYAGARRLGLDRPRAVASALLTAALPTAHVLLLATVPEFWTAALAFFGLSTLTDDDPDFRGALALAAATFCRYETWALAAGYALVVAARAVRSSPGKRLPALGCALLALAGVAVWLVHGYLVHGSPLFFVARVQQYKAALGHGAPSAAEVWLGYPKELVWREPELAIAALFGGACTLGARRKADAGKVDAGEAERPQPRAFVLALPLTLALLVLVLGDVRGGAPTHHPERALLTLWFFAVPATLAALGARVSRRRWLVVLAVTLAIAGPVRWLRPAPNYADRTDEEAAGRLVAERLGSRAHVVLATEDYGYLAIQAAAGRPERFLIADRHDPREALRSGSPVARALALARETSTVHVVAPVCWDFEQGRSVAHTRDFRLLSLDQLPLDQLSPDLRSPHAAP